MHRALVASLAYLEAEMYTGFTCACLKIKGREECIYTFTYLLRISQQREDLTFLTLPVNIAEPEKNQQTCGSLSIVPLVHGNLIHYIVLHWRFTPR